MKFSFSRDYILELDPEEFSDAEKKELLERFFPVMPLPDWKSKLRKDWNDARRWAAYTGSEKLGEDGLPYRFNNAHLLQLAKLRPPSYKGTRVTDFTRWIYSLYRGRPDPQSLLNGKLVERQIASKIASVPESSDWELIYEDPLDQPPKPKKITALKIEGEPMWGAPDLVFKSKFAPEIIIVERKASNRDIPADGWPNLRAQLWAYGHIDDWVEIERIHLIGEIWGFAGGKVFLRKVLRWDFRDANFYRPNEKLFQAYQSAECNKNFD